MKKNKRFMCFFMLCLFTKKVFVIQCMLTKKYTNTMYMIRRLFIYGPINFPGLSNMCTSRPNLKNTR